MNRRAWWALFACWFLAGGFLVLGEGSESTTPPPVNWSAPAQYRPHAPHHRPQIVPAPVHTSSPAAKPRTVQKRTHIVRTPAPKVSGGCVVGQPCDLTHLHWTRKIGCTKTWLANQRRLNPAATCPPGYPYLG